ncbi:MAG: hypothetical protein CGU28_13430 [Candidatus Dactylopiibacterium carminicum]|uniref:YtxH domain-containing protein n=1 Tax=Candidatus Dactylopiibacterium carminicum TaxID=857335 RepID=A0A272EP60_9RHOO|nr:hypothetical protein [Candidatus Dactylopiibacterium carminicum]KAF7598222.1 hypothetical protein BGI27_14505 [Candidatus Dactylopiibacterium carminicum]PAS91881.1 MAG: hypothetical protein CGU29_14125 [Candidatus Dactylopiibacterium carminicum]PAS94849.1 MAG: hypothetical protein CGU28_13430 [Candidatus Dactylopiibacterium carminicum]PAS97016.1 MAG: hypothetical protein BSR46_14540 [Candidatus Dactylopiibacterium carminicum]
MAKKKLKKALRKLLKEEAARNAATAGSTAQGYGYGQEADDNATLAPLNAGFLSGLGLPAGFGSRRTEQFLLGALLGAAATYVLSNEEVRSKLVKGAMKLYGSVAGGIEELKEHMADLKAEVEAERTGE